jgi:hypothetical protein
MRATRRNDEPRPRPVSSVVGALWREFEAIHGKPQAAALGRGLDPSLQAYYLAALAEDQAALCLSGGGIRSAAFALGVLRALAKQKLLTRFHYLSTVSGGGYIGGWLLTMANNHGGDLHEVQALLAADTAAAEVRTLRQYTDFLSPNFGLFSPDTWAGVTLWLRNVLINWLIFLPALFALAQIPNLYAAAVAAIAPGWLSDILLAAALLSLGLAVHNGAAELPSHVDPTRGAVGANGALPVWVKVVIPNTLWAILVPLVAAPWLRQAMPVGALNGDLIPLLGFAAMELAALGAALRSGKASRLYWRNSGAWTIAALASSITLWLWLDFAIGASPSAIAVLGPLAVATSHLVLTLTFVALRIEAYRGDLDREWLGRLSAEKLIPSVIWAVFAATCLLLPWLIFDEWTTWLKPWLLALWMAAGPVAAYAGKVSKAMPGAPPAAERRTQRAVRLLPDLVAAAFGAALFMLLARLGSVITGDGLWARLGWVAVTALFALGLGRRINVNRFSMHAVYRNRLVRGFLGPAQRARNPDPFTGIDPRDNPRMADLFARFAACRTLFPVVNVTLNVVSGRNTAWAERKAESFTITPLACGGAYLHKVEDVAAGRPPRGAYVPTENYAGNEPETGADDPSQGVTLGTALALSGAAVSPNMGYHSSPATAFLMTLFNVRLGAWLPNPAIASIAQMERPRPPNALLSLAHELLGLTDDRRRDIYLSDGGHFENLGLYEMIRRRCRYIFVVDAGEDGDAHFEDLGNAIRKVRIDLDVRVVFDPPVGIGSRGEPLLPFRDFACATVHYPENDAIPGYLIYLKPSFPPKTAIDVRAYGNAHPTFPHESTIDQFFTESQFESYRQLGEDEAGQLAPGVESIVGFFDAARQSRAASSAPGCST